MFTVKYHFLALCVFFFSLLILVVAGCSVVWGVLEQVHAPCEQSFLIHKCLLEWDSVRIASSLWSRASPNFWIIPSGLFMVITEPAVPIALRPWLETVSQQQAALAQKRSFLDLCRVSLEYAESSKLEKDCMLAGWCSLSLIGSEWMNARCHEMFSWMNGVVAL